METIQIIAIVLGCICTTIIPLGIKLYTAIKAYKGAKTDADKEAAKNEMLAVVNAFIESAEMTYKDLDALLKGQGGSGGAVKKETVMTKLQAYAMEKGYAFDAEYWGAKVDEIVAMTRKVNAKV